MGNPEVFASELKYLTTPDQSGHQQISQSQLFFHWIALPPGPRFDCPRTQVLETRDGRVT